MDEIKFIIAGNIAQLRKNSSITQAELAQKLNYSDKAVSKWERGESLPDIAVLKEIADLFGVTVDYLLKEDHSSAKDSQPVTSKRKYINRVMIMLISMVLVLFLALFVFVNIKLFSVKFAFDWVAFIVSIPVICIVWLVFNSIWFNKRINYLIISILMWSCILAIFLLAVYILQTNVSWLIFMLGIPGQVIIILWSYIRPSKRK